MISLEKNACCKSMRFAIKKWSLYADAINGFVSINEDLEAGEISVDNFKFCPWCAKPIAEIYEI
jgi:hypothetical protein